MDDEYVRIRYPDAIRMRLDIHHRLSAEDEIDLRGAAAAWGASGRILAAPKTDSHNDLAHPNAVASATYVAGLGGGRLLAELRPIRWRPPSSLGRHNLLDKSDNSGKIDMNHIFRF